MNAAGDKSVTGGSLSKVDHERMGQIVFRSVIRKVTYSPALVSGDLAYADVPGLL